MQDMLRLILSLRLALHNGRLSTCGEMFDAKVRTNVVAEHCSERYFGFRFGLRMQRACPRETPRECSHASSERVHTKVAEA